MQALGFTGLGVLVGSGALVFVGGGGLVLVGGTGVLVGAEVGAEVALGPDVWVTAPVGVGAGWEAVAAVGDDPTSVCRMTSVLPEVGEGPEVAVRVGEGVAVGGKGLSPGARVRVAAGGDVGKTRPNPSEVGVPAESPPNTIAATAGSFTDVPLAAKVWTTAA